MKKLFLFHNHHIFFKRAEIQEKIIFCFSQNLIKKIEIKRTQKIEESLSDSFCLE